MTIRRNARIIKDYTQLNAKPNQVRMICQRLHSLTQISWFSVLSQVSSPLFSNPHFLDVHLDIYSKSYILFIGVVGPFKMRVSVTYFRGSFMNPKSMTNHPKLSLSWSIIHAPRGKSERVRKESLIIHSNMFILHRNLLGPLSSPHMWGLQRWKLLSPGFLAILHPLPAMLPLEGNRSNLHYPEWQYLDFL